MTCGETLPTTCKTSGNKFITFSYPHTLGRPYPVAVLIHEGHVCRRACMRIWTGARCSGTYRRTGTLWVAVRGHVTDPLPSMAGRGLDRAEKVRARIGFNPHNEGSRCVSLPREGSSSPEERPGSEKPPSGRVCVAAQACSRRSAATVPASRKGDTGRPIAPEAALRFPSLFPSALGVYPIRAGRKRG